ncbi:MAG: hypothetical protein WCT37_00150 [Patescibacteria group bacterium]|jgi:hypothetical protein
MSKLIDLTFGPWRFIVRRLHRRYQVRYKFNRKHLVADLIMFLAVVVLILGNLYLNLIFAKWAIALKVRTEIAVSEIVQNGSETKIAVRYFNSNKTDVLRGALLKLDLPVSFQAETASDPRYDLKTGAISLGDILPGKGGALELTGEVWGDSGSEAKIFSHLSYTQENQGSGLSWSAERLGSASYRISGSVVGCQLTMPETAVNQSAFDFNLACANNYREKLGNLEVKLNADSGQIIDSTVGPFNELGAGEKTDFSARARFNLPEKADRGRLGYQLFGQAPDGRRLLLDQGETSVNIFHAHFSVKAELIGQAADYAPLPGEELEYRLVYQNNEKEAIKYLAISVDLTSPLWDITSVKGDQTFAFSDRQLIFAERGETSPGKRGVLAPGQSEEFKFKIKTVKTVVAGLTPPVYLILAPVADYSLLVNGVDFAVTVDGQASKNLLSSSLDLEALARYYTAEGEQLGVGPLPPAVGIPTKYRIFWQVSVSYNPVSEIKVVGTLAPNVSWTGQESVSAGAGLNFDPKTNQISWAPGVAAALTGYGSLPQSANFALSLIPLASQIGRPAVLLEDITITGRDQTTGRELRQTIPSITTDLFSDPLGRGKGRVVNWE